MREQLQGFFRIIRRLIEQLRVAAVMQQRRTERGHVHAQLVLAPGDGLQAVGPVFATAMDHIDHRFAVRFTGCFGHAEERFARHQLAAVHVGKCQMRQWRGNGQLFLVDTPLAKQRLVRDTGVGVGREQHQPVGIALDAVQGHQVRVVPPLAQPRQNQRGQVYLTARPRPVFLLLEARTTLHTCPQHFVPLRPDKSARRAAVASGRCTAMLTLRHRLARHFCISRHGYMHAADVDHWQVLTSPLPASACTGARRANAGNSATNGPAGIGLEWRAVRLPAATLPTSPGGRRWYGTAVPCSNREACPQAPAAQPQLVNTSKPP